MRCYIEDILVIYIPFLCLLVLPVLETIIMCIYYFFNYILGAWFSRSMYLLSRLVRFLFHSPALLIIILSLITVLYDGSNVSLWHDMVSYVILMMRCYTFS